MQYRLFIGADPVSGEVEINTIKDILDNYNSNPANVAYVITEVELRGGGKSEDAVAVEILFITEEDMKTTVAMLKSALQHDLIAVQETNPIVRF